MDIRKLLYLFLVPVLLLGCSGSKRLVSKMDSYIVHGKYAEAIDIYNQSENADDDAQMVYNRAIAHYNLCNYEQALADFTKAFRLGNRAAELYLYTGKVLHRLGRYSDAVPFYKDFIAKSGDEVANHKTIESIKRAGFGVDMQYTDPIGYVENLGDAVNSQYDEMAPVESPNNPNKFYFSSNKEGSTGGLRDKEGYRDAIYGSYAFDMYGIEIINGNWTPSFTFDPILNTARNEIIQGFSKDGSVLFFKKSLDGTIGEILVDTFQVDRPSDRLPVSLRSDVAASIGDDDIALYNDRYMIFSSRREGGYGGYDLYISEKTLQGWSPALNMGPQVNSPYDERDPFLTRNGKRLFFSSDRLDSYGGFDIFTTTYDDIKRSWTTPENYGLPVNSPSDDRGFYVTHDGRRALLSSDRDGSLGGFDLYFAYLKESIIDQSGRHKDSLDFFKELKKGSPVVEKEIYTDPTTALASKEIVVPILYYGKDGNPLTPANKVSLDNLVANLKIYPETSIILNGGTMPDSDKAYDLFFSVKRAEQVASYLTENGISADRILVRGLGYNFPYVPISRNQNLRQAENYNRYVEIQVISKEAGLNSTVEMLPIATASRDPQGLAYRNIIQGLSYKVMVAKVNQMFNGNLLDQYPAFTVDKHVNSDQYVYYLGIYDNYRDARFMKNELVRNGVSNATIVPFENGLKLSLTEVQMLSDKYSDLKEYLLFEE